MHHYHSAWCVLGLKLLCNLIWSFLCNCVSSGSQWNSTSRYSTSKSESLAEQFVRSLPAPERRRSLMGARMQFSPYKVTSNIVCRK